MKDLTRKERAAAAAMAAAVMAAVVYSSDCLLLDGILTWGMRQREYLAMIGEIGRAHV